MQSSRVSLIFWCLSTALFAGVISGCSTAKRQSDAEASQETAKEAAKEPLSPAEVAKEEANAARAQVAELKAALSSMTSRLDSIETRMGSLNDKVAGTQNSMEMLLANRKALPSAVSSHPSEGAGTDSPVPVADNDPEAGFVADAAIQEYRKGSILLEAQKYPEAILAFSSFVERYPDHPLAGSAQFGIGKSYFKQKEYKLALKELERVLTSYDRSPHVSDTLRDLAETEEALKMPEQAARHRQLLTSLFAQSPAAANRVAAREPESTAPAKAAAPAPAAPEPSTTAHTLPTAPLTAPQAVQ
jgi:TolA-binding protein